MKTRPNESAFPWITGDWNEYDPELNEGMTKRELFAAMICAGFNANPEGNGLFADYARDAVMQADALIAALNKEEGSADA